VARRGDVVTPIVELVEVCDAWCAVDLGWFEVLGERVRHEPDPALQRLFATASQRHAWHAELWAQRRPAIPHDAVHPAPEPVLLTIAGDDLVTAYRRYLTSQRKLLAELRAATDPDLDPATRRVVTLVDADLADLQARLDTVRPVRG